MSRQCLRIFTPDLTFFLVPFTKCKAEDSKCIKDNTQVLVPLFAAGIPELGVETMDPVFFKDIDASTPSLKLKFSDITLKGLKSCRFKKIRQVNDSFCFLGEQYNFALILPISIKYYRHLLVLTFLTYVVFC